MIKSEPILPIRFYDDLFDQHRFNVHCNKTQQIELVYPTNRLPHFQLRRTSKLTSPSMFFLRNVCHDVSENNVGFGTIHNYYQELPEAASIFSNYAATELFDAFPPTQGAIVDNGSDPPYGTVIPIGKITCRGLSNADKPDDTALVATPYGYFDIPLASASQKYKFKIVVDKFVRSPGSTFKIKLLTDTAAGTDVIGEITEAGVYHFDFTSTTSFLSVVFVDISLDDEYDISYVQVSIDKFDSILLQDYELDETKIKIQPMKNGTDILIFCEAQTNRAITPGTYYYVIVDGSNYYFSEPFKIISIKDAEKYYQITWGNSCDINNSVIFNTSAFSCTYQNSLYLDASLFKPEPETREEGEENGIGEVTPLYKQWKKNINFEIPKSPEFLTDALSALFLFSDVRITKPLNNLQQKIGEYFTVKKIIPEVTNILNDCFQKVNFKLLLNENYTQSGCCTNAEIEDCTPCTYSAGVGEDYDLTLSTPPEEGDGLILKSTSEVIEVEETDLICFEGKYYRLTKVGGIWQVNSIAPTIYSVATISSLNFDVEVYVVPYSFAVLEYNKNGAGWVEFGSYLSGADGYLLINFRGSALTGSTDLKIRVNSKTLNCNFGRSDVEDIV